MNSSNSGVWPGSTHPPGDRMWATLTASWPLFSRPTYSSMSLGLFPAASTRVGEEMSVGTPPSVGRRTGHRPKRGGARVALTAVARTVAVVPHTHWDREWYQPFQAFRLRLVDVLDDVLDRLEADPSIAHFLLDGQMAAVDDYLAVRPENEPRLRRLAVAGRIAVGPWYVLPDEFLVSGETLVRNLQMGLERAAAFGGAMDVGYLPDMFGHIAQMPQILRQAGFDHAVVWRGVPAAVNRTAFWWRGRDGSGVRAEYLPVGYGNGAAMPDDAKALVERIRAHETELGALLPADAPLLWMNGGDHQRLQAHVGRIVAEADELTDDHHLHITSLAEYLAASSVVGLPTWTGEMRSGARANLLMGVASNRVDVKQAAARAERSLERLAEPLSALFAGEDTWPDDALRRAWTEVVRNAAHDSVCACSADDVVAAVLTRYAEATQIAEALTARAMAAFGASMSVDGARRGQPVGPHPQRPGRARPPRRRARSRAGRWFRRGSARPPSGWSPAASSGSSSARRPTRKRRGAAPSSASTWPTTSPGSTWSSAPAPARRHPTPSSPPPSPTSTPGPAPAAATRSTSASSTSPTGGFSSGPTTWPASDGGPGRRPTRRRPSLPSSPPAPPTTGSRWPTASSPSPSTARDGTFSIDDRRGLDLLVDDADAGDTYNYSPPDGDVPVDAPSSVTIDIHEHGPLRASLRVVRTFDWPERLEGGRVRTGSRAVEVSTRLELRAGERLVRVTTSFDNQCRDHRLRAWFPLPGAGHHLHRRVRLRHRRAGSPGRGRGHRAGPAHVPVPPVRHPPAASPSSTRACSNTSWSTTARPSPSPCCAASACCRAPTSPTDPCPRARRCPVEGAQMLGRRVLRYAVAVADDDPYALVDDAFLPLVVAPGSGSGTRPAAGAALSVTGAQVSAVRRRPGGRLEVRVFNPSDEEATVDLGGRSGWLVDLRHHPLEPVAGTFRLRPWGIATVHLDGP